MASTEKTVFLEPSENPDMGKATDVQVGGDHYQRYKIQPIEFIQSNNIGFCEGNVIKYVTRWKDKNGVEDLKKAKHYIDLLIQVEELDGTFKGNTVKPPYPRKGNEYDVDN